MNKLVKKYTKIEFLKMLLDDGGAHRCEFCKYSWRNYIYTNRKTQEMTLNHFSNRCHECTSNYLFIRLSKEEKDKKHWYTDRFKPLYDWEEGENNE